MRDPRKRLPRSFVEELRAYHEAGHAVAALLKGFSVKSVSIRQYGARGGECEYVAQVRFHVPRASSARRIPKPVLRRLVRATTAVALGGSVAQDNITLERGYIGCDERTGQPLPLFAPGAEQDERLALTIAGALFRRRSDRREFIRRMRSSTERLLTSTTTWRAVRTLAIELRRRRKLEAAQVERVVRNALRPVVRMSDGSRSAASRRAS